MTDHDPYRKPAGPPAADIWDNLVRWQKLTDSTQARSLTTAQAWRNGLAGLVTLLTSALILKGPDAAKIDTPARYLVVGFLGLGLAFAVWGLWKALGAEAPAQGSVAYADALKAHGSIAAYEQTVAKESAAALSRARWRVFLALALLLVGSVIWWLVPAAESPALLKVTRADASVVCGKQSASPDGNVIISVNKASSPVSVTLSSARAVAAVASCDE